MFEESLALHRELGTKKGIAIVLSNLGNVLMQQGYHAHARVLRMEALVLQGGLGDELGIVWSLELYAKMGMRRRKGVEEGNTYERAARLWGATEALHRRVQFPLPLSAKEHQRFEKVVTEFRLQLSSPFLKQAWAEGEAMSMEQAITYALEGT